MPAATPMEGGGGGGRLTADFAGGGGGRVSFTTASSLGGDTALPIDVPPPKIAQPRDHEASVVVWTDLSLHDVDELLEAAEQNAVALQEKLAEFFDLKDHETNLRSSVLLDLYFYTIQFALENEFTKDQISASFSIVKKTFEVCVETPFGNLDQTYDCFKNLVLCHSVKRPPFSLDIFGPPQAKKLTEYIINTFFRHFKLYKYCFTPKVRLDLSINYFGTPVTPPPLATTLGEKASKFGQEEEKAREEEDKKEDGAEAGKPAEVAVGELPPGQRELRRLIEAQLMEQLTDLKTNLESQIKSADETLQGKLAAVEAEFGTGRRGKRK